MTGALAVAMLPLLSARPAGAAVFTVTNCSGSATTVGSLPYLVQNASSGSTIRFPLIFGCNTIPLQSTLTIGENLTIVGPLVTPLALSGGGSLRVLDVETGARVSLSFLAIEDGLASEEGGGILNDGNLTLLDVKMNHNTVTTGGDGAAGGGALANDGSATVSYSTISDNLATSTGYGTFAGGIANSGGALTLSLDTFSGNQADNTGGGDALGGAVSDGTGTVTITGSTFTDNSATGSYGTYGGAIDGGSYGISTGNITISDSTFSGNSATGTYYGPGSGGGADGGAINTFGTMVVSDSTIADNTSTTNSTYGVGGTGGGLNNFGWMTVDHVTLVGNTANAGSSSSDSIGAGGDSLSIVGSIVAAGVGGRECLGGPIIDKGYNIDDDGTCGFTGPGSVSDSTSLDGFLGSLAYNGGDTETIALFRGSPAISLVKAAADCVGRDQRGVAWPTPCDAGSVQLPVAPGRLGRP